MSGCFVDTSVLVRYLTGDVPELLAAAAQILDEAELLYLSEGILAETAYVLLSFYKIPRERVVDSLIDLVSKKNITLQPLDKGLVVEALLLCRPSGRVSFGDALLWAVARSSQSDPCLYSFDNRFPGGGLELRTSL